MVDCQKCTLVPAKETVKGRKVCRGCAMTLLPVRAANYAHQQDEKAERAAAEAEKTAEMDKKQKAATSAQVAAALQELEA